MLKPVIAAFTASILVATSFCGGARASSVFDVPGKSIRAAKETRAAERKSTSQEKNIRLACCGYKK